MKSNYIKKELEQRVGKKCTKLVLINTYYCLAIVEFT